MEPSTGLQIKLWAVVNLRNESPEMSCGGSIGQCVSVEEQRSYWPESADLCRNNYCHYSRTARLGVTVKDDLFTLWLNQSGSRGLKSWGAHHLKNPPARPEKKTKKTLICWRVFHQEHEGQSGKEWRAVKAFKLLWLAQSCSWGRESRWRRRSWLEPNKRLCDLVAGFPK